MNEMAEVVQQGIDEILRLREINAELLEALKSVCEALCDLGECDIDILIQSLRNANEAIRKAEEQS